MNKYKNTLKVVNLLRKLIKNLQLYIKKPFFPDLHMNEKLSEK